MRKAFILFGLLLLSTTQIAWVSVPLVPVGDLVGFCQMKMVDSLNSLNVKLQVRQPDKNLYLVTDQLGTADANSVKVRIKANGQIESGAGIPVINKRSLMRNYQMRNDKQLTFIRLKGHNCTPFEENLIYFLVMEWFYFG